MFGDLIEYSEKTCNQDGSFEIECNADPNQYPPGGGYWTGPVPDLDHKFGVVVDVRTGALTSLSSHVLVKKMSKPLTTLQPLARGPRKPARFPPVRNRKRICQITTSPPLDCNWDGSSDLLGRPAVDQAPGAERGPHRRLRGVADRRFRCTSGVAPPPKTHSIRRYSTTPPAVFSGVNYTEIC